MSIRFKIHHGIHINQSILALNTGKHPYSEVCENVSKFGAPADEIFGVEPLSVNILGDEVLVALMGNKVDVKTMDLTRGPDGDR